MRRGDTMYSLNRELREDLHLGTVVWACKSNYYVEPDNAYTKKAQMFLINKLNPDYFLGSPLSIRKGGEKSTVLNHNFYPLRSDSILIECLYRIPYEDIVNNKTFQITEGTLTHFRRNLYKRIILGEAYGLDEYNEMFVRDYLEDNKPSINDIVVYTTEEKNLQYYYICEEDENTYFGFWLNREDGYNRYTLASDEIEEVSKEKRFFDYYRDPFMKGHNDIVGEGNKVKKIGSIITG